tara:strand:- start:52 stop:564 length:513 start_codon:yes stop_codon:yes gene_type:complete
MDTAAKDAGSEGTVSNELWYAKTVNKPSFTINAAEHKYLNHTYYYPGNVTWNEVTLALVDPTDPDVGGSFAAFIQNSGYLIPGATVEGTSTISKSKAVEALGTVKVIQLDADGAPIETWTMWNCWISDVKFGDLEYGADDLTQIDVTLKYDWAQITAADGASNFFEVSGA